MSKMKQDVNTSATSNQGKKEAEESEHIQVTRKAARGTVVSFLLRILSFGCTQWTLRSLDPSTLGKTSVQLELLYTTVVFLSREGFRLALTRNVSPPVFWNIAWLTLPVSTLVSIMGLVWHLHWSSYQDDPDYAFAGVLYCVAACLEGWAEPAVLASLRHMNVAVKASAEGVATLAKTAATLIVLQMLPSSPVTAFGVAQIIYAAAYFVLLYSKAWKDLCVPRWREQSLDAATCYMIGVFTVQGIFKHMLTEGDRIVLATLSGSYDQGVYAMGSAYGGLAARLILQPMEENGRLLWSRVASVGRPTNESANDSAKADAALEASYTVLVKLVLYLGFIFSALAVNYTSLLLSVLGGGKWGGTGETAVEASRVLSAFCVYTGFLAWNGMTEAFVYAVAATGGDLGRLGLAHIIVGLVFATSAAAAVNEAGTVGLVAANCLAMVLRASYSVYCAAVYFSKRKQTSTMATVSRLLDRMFPKRSVLLAFGISFLLTRDSLATFQRRVSLDAVSKASPTWIRLAARHVGVGATCGVGILTLAYYTEKDFRSSIRSIWHGRNK